MSVHDVREGTPRWSPVGAAVPVAWLRKSRRLDRSPGDWYVLPDRRGAVEIGGGWWPITPEGAALLDLHLAGARLR